MIARALSAAAWLMAAWAVPVLAGDYDDLPLAKAMAEPPAAAGGAPVTVHGAPSDLAAALQALQVCQAETSQPCELIRLNDEQITRGAEIRARAPDAPHPLFLWRFRHGATELFLAGSIHILKPTLYPLPAPFDAAFARSDHLVLEVDLSTLSERDIQQQTLTRGLLPAGQTLADVLPDELGRKLAEALPAYGLTFDAVSRAKPALVMNQLVVARLMTLGYLPESGIESHYLARRDARPVLALETLESQLALLLDQPMDTQVALLADAVATAAGVEPLLADLLTAWFTGDDTRFMALFQAQPGHVAELAAFQQAVLTDRNHTMAAAIARLLESDGEHAAAPRTYFTLVGAAHLVGPDGIVTLLGQRGYEGERILSDQSL